MVIRRVAGRSRLSVRAEGVWTRAVSIEHVAFVRRTIVIASPRETVSTGPCTLEIDGGHPHACSSFEPKWCARVHGFELSDSSSPRHVRPCSAAYRSVVGTCRVANRSDRATSRSHVPQSGYVDHVRSRGDAAGMPVPEWHAKPLGHEVHSPTDPSAVVMEHGITDDDRKRMATFMEKSFLDRSPEDLVPREDE